MNKTKQLIFKVSPFLISIDGPDGAGKSSFAQVLVSKLKLYLDSDKIKLIKPSYFDTSFRAQYIGRKLTLLKSKLVAHSKLHNNFFLAAMTVNYRDIILPTIRSKNIAVLDSSEIRALAFITDKGTLGAFKDTVMKIKRGALTCGIQPKIRIILDGSPEDLYQNLKTKNSLDNGDPYTIKEIERRIKSYRRAIDVVQKLNVDKIVDWRVIKIYHVNNSFLEEYFSNIIDRIEVIPVLAKYIIQILYNADKIDVIRSYK